MLERILQTKSQLRIPEHRKFTHLESNPKKREMTEGNNFIKVRVLITVKHTNIEWENRALYERMKNILGSTSNKRFVNDSVAEYLGPTKLNPCSSSQENSSSNNEDNQSFDKKMTNKILPNQI